jgi:holo-[acyl-carrier protein] synthase
MIIGTGIDIIEVDRVAEKLTKVSGFRDKIFSIGESQYCESKPNANEHFAARFAAKEAFLKATGKGLTITYDLFEIEVVHDELDRPSIKLNGNVARIAGENGWNKIHLSLSHVKSMACAFVIIEHEERT